ncbi:MAG: hypothetical protein ABJF86_06435 [Tateyamaria sp.]|uniref:hypothetical protein n=1 Tax=Tateyamaria sp. TaxID=1929288 RepID=UPI0032918FEF
MEGKTILLGNGSFGAREGEKYLGLFGLEGKVTLTDSELSNAVDALKNGQIDGFVTAGSYPALNVIEAAAISTTSLPVVAYTKSAMSDDTAYLLTKTFWEQRDDMGSAAAWWNGISPDMIANITDAHRLYQR